MDRKVIDQMRAAAEAATPGEWWVDEGWCVRTSENGLIAETFDGGVNSSYALDPDANAAHIALWNPVNALALLDERDALSSQLADVDALRRACFSALLEGGVMVAPGSEHEAIQRLAASRDALLDRLEKAEGAWQPIEEHDGSEAYVLLAEADGSVCEGRLLDDDRGWWARNNDPTDYWGEELRPTHFRPLPAPPARASLNGEQQ